LISPAAAKPQPGQDHITGAKHAERCLAGDGRKLVAGVADPGLPAIAYGRGGTDLNETGYNAALFPGRQGRKRRI
jgi:hypothetical protein